MVYLYKKPIGNRSYYYLRASEKKKGKLITKDIAYLGNSLEEVKNSLDKLPEHAEKIRKAYKTIQNFLESNHYLEKAKSLKIKKDDLLQEKLFEIEACKLHYQTKFFHYPELTKKEILKNFIIEFAFNTTSIEGNTINLKETKNLLEEGLTPKNKELREIFDLQNTEKVLIKLSEEKPTLSHETILEVHKMLMEKIDQRTRYRTMDVRVIKANFKATPAPYVKTDMGLLLEWYKTNEKKLHPLVLALAFHHKFEKIHPFFDGNGRAGRMLLNLILLNNNYPPIIIRKKTRTEYLNALRKADHSPLFTFQKEAYTPLTHFATTEYTTSYWNTFL